MKKIYTVGVILLLLLTFLGSVSIGKITDEEDPISMQDSYKLNIARFMLCGEPINNSNLPQQPGCYRQYIINMKSDWSLCCISACPYFKRQSQDGFCCICEGSRFSGTVKFTFFIGNICAKYTQEDTLKYSMCGVALGVVYTGDCP